MQDSHSSQTLNEHEASRYIGMSRSWLAQARSNGNENAPPFLKLGRAVRYLRSDLDDWLADQRSVETNGVSADIIGHGAKQT